MSTLTEDAKQVGELRAEYERLKVAMDAAKLEYEAAHAAMWQRMEDEDVGAIKVGSTNFVRAQTVYSQIQDREAFVQWALEESPELVQYKERAQQLNELVRERVESGQELPPGCGFYVKQFVGQRAA